MSIIPCGEARTVPISELLANLLAQITETVRAAHEVLIERESFLQLSHYLEKMSPVFARLQSRRIEELPTLRNSLEALASELQNAKDIVDTYQTKSKFYLFINCRPVMKKMQQTLSEIGSTLSFMVHLGLSRDCEEMVMRIFRETPVFEFKMAAVAEEIVNKIELGLQERRKSNNFSNELVTQIAKAVGVDLCPSLLKLELEQLKRDKEMAEFRKHKSEALQLDQILALLSWADVACSFDEKEKMYHVKGVPLGSCPLPPLHAFFCPITQEIMEDPVEISSGHTFERSAIQQWLAAGHMSCPVSSGTLVNSELKPNAILRRSINEWRERNAMIQLTALRKKLRSKDEEVVLATLDELLAMCQSKSIHWHWIAAEGSVPALVSLLRSTKSSIRKKTLLMLTMTVKGNFEVKDRACAVGAMALIVNSLAHEVSESRLAVALLLELSNERKLCKQLSKVHGCIFLLVALSNSELDHAAEDAKAVLENLSKIKERNAVFMAEASYFEPLLHYLNEGAGTTKMLMTNALAQMELTDMNRKVLIQMGVLSPLLRILSEGNLELKSAALGALQNLSECSEMRSVIVKAGAVRLVLELLFTEKSVLMTMKEQAAVVFGNLASSTSMPHDCIEDLLGTDPKSTIYRLLSLLNVSGPRIQSQILIALSGMSYPPSAHAFREAIREAGAVELLVIFYLANTNMDTWVHALKLLQLLSQDEGGETLATEMGPEMVQSLTNLLATQDDTTKALVLGLFHNVPLENRTITDMLVDAGLLPVLKTILQGAASYGALNELVENAAGVLFRFTLSSNMPLQQKVVAYGAVPLLLQLLRSGTPKMKCYSARALGELSESTWKRTCRIKKTKHFWCLGPQMEDVCIVHGGVCTIEKSFCLVQAQAVPLLIQALEEQDSVVLESALGAIATLLYDEFWDKGTDYLVDAGGVLPIINLLSMSDAKVLESTLWILERVFRKERYRIEYGNTAQMALVLLTQDGRSKTRHLAARILAYLHVLQDHSTYF